MEPEKRELILSSLENVLQSSEFSTSERLSDFLRFIVTETLDGRGERLKAYSIAVGAFKFEETFDPQENSLVRVEASRLRKKLNEYYKGAGVADPFEIRVTKGSYVPEFISRYRHTGTSSRDDHPNIAPSSTALLSEQTAHVKAGAIDAFPHGIQDQDIPMHPPGRAGLNIWKVGTFLGACISILFLILHFSFEHRIAPASAIVAIDRFASPPSLAVANLEVEPELGLTPPYLQSMSRELQSAFAPFQSVRLIDAQSGLGSEALSEYQLTGDVAKSGTVLQLTFRLLYRADGQVIWTRSFDTSGPNLDEQSRASIAAIVATTLARSYGVITADRYRRMPPLSKSTRGYSCIVHAFKYFETPREDIFRSASGCLEASIDASPNDSALKSSLAAMLVDGYVKGSEEGRSRDMLQQANRLALQAVALSPQSAQSYLALFMARFADKRYDEAFEAGEKSIVLNPYSTEAKFRVGSAYVVRGAFAKGMNLLQDGLANSEYSPAWTYFYHFLNAYMNGDDEGARQIAERQQWAKSPFSLLARIIICHRHDDAEGVSALRAQLAEEFPQFSGDIEGALSRLGLVDSIRARLVTDLRAAGVLPVSNL